MRNSTDITYSPTDGSLCLYKAVFCNEFAKPIIRYKLPLGFNVLTMLPTLHLVINCDKLGINVEDNRYLFPVVSAMSCCVR